ncbi:MAG: cytochrome c biogenesis protein CcsA [Chitinophagales bacterium]|jgi:heme exporter protein C|nr:cytochrome c biogenesis protein [Sphingobacteriales bacterium]
MNFLNQRFLQFLCIFLIGYSFLGGLLLPLSPNIEKLDYKSEDTTLVLNLSIPKLKEKVGLFYLKKSVLGDTSSLILKPTHIQKLETGYVLKFSHPSLFKEFQKEDVLDLICHTETWGGLRYFSAYYLDTVIGTRLLPNNEKINLPEKQFHWSFPNRTILRESIRNLFYHVPMWFTMMALLIYSLVHSILYLSSGKMTHDLKASRSAGVASFFGVLGILTGMIWAKFTWGAFWTNDPKLNGAAIGMLVYLAYFVLRGSLDDEIKRAKLAAVYNIFSFTIYMVFIWILPRINDSLHPGNGGNPGFNVYEQDNVMRLFFYPAVLGWIFLGFWLTEAYVKLKEKKGE